MPVRFLSDAQREQLSGFPVELDAEALDRFFTFSDADLAEARRRHGDGNRLGWSLLLCGLRMLGFCPDDVTTAPAGAVRFVARQLGVDPGALDSYGLRAQTRSDHASKVKAYLGFRAATSSDLEAIRDWLADEAMVQDRPVVLFQLACGRLFQLGLVRPGLTVIEQSLVGAAREAARVETARRVAPLLTEERCRMLDELLVVDAGLGMARVTWLRQFPVQASPAAMLCLTLVVNCVAAFNAGLLGQAVEQLRAAGFDIDDADIAHLGPTMSEHLNVHGRYRFDLDGAPKGLRPIPQPPQTTAH